MLLLVSSHIQDDSDLKAATAPALQDDSDQMAATAPALLLPRQRNEEEEIRKKRFHKINPRTNESRTCII